MLLVSVEIDCDVCMDRIVEGETSATSARKMARRLGAKIGRGVYGEQRHECAQCVACRTAGHSMEAVSSNFSRCERCGMTRSKLLNATAYVLNGVRTDNAVPKCAVDAG